MSPICEVHPQGHTHDRRYYTEQEVNALLAALTLIGLDDTPASYTGEAGLFLRVKATEDGIEFAAGGAGTFAGLTDTPANYAAAAGLLVRVNAVPDGLEFIVGTTLYAALVHAARHQNGGADEISVAALSGLLADDQHVLDAEVLAAAATMVLNDFDKTDLADPGADKMVFWDDGADAFAFLAARNGLSITGTDLDAEVFASGRTKGDILYADANNSLAWLPRGADDEIFKMNVDVPNWEAAGAGDVTAAANITDHSIVRGDGGAKGVQDSGWTLGDDDVLNAADNDIVNIKELHANDGVLSVVLPSAGTVYIKGVMGGDWYNVNWDYRVGITSQNAKVDEAVTNAYVDLSEMPSEFWDNVKNGGGDIRVTEADGLTEVAREVVFCDTGTDKGEVHFDCTDIQTGSDVTWYIYYGNAAAVDYDIDAEFGAEAVWDANYKFVGHLHSDFLDSTANDNDATNVGTDDVAGKMGQGQDNVLANSDYIHIDGLAASFDDYIALTISFWFNPDVDAHGTMFGNAGNNDGAPYVKITTETTKAVKISIADDAPAVEFTAKTANNIFTLSQWTDLHYTGAAASNKTYIDGLLKAMSYTNGNAATGGTPAAHGMTTGTRLNWGSLRRAGAAAKNFFDGLLDELRISDIDRSANWISTQHNNQDDPATFWNIGPEEEEPVMSEANLDVQDKTTTDALFLRELAAALADVAGEGQFWVKDDAPCTPWFTDDAGNDTRLAQWQLVAESELGAPAASVTFAAIPGTYDELVLVIQARVDRVAELDSTYIRFNGDAGNNYDYIFMLIQGNGTLTGGSGVAGALAYAGGIEAANSRASNFGATIIHIPGYAETDREKWMQVLCATVMGDTSVNTDMFHYMTNSRWRSTAAISTILLYPSVGPNFVAGSHFRLYGVVAG